jgi:hypothetical protein
VGNYASRFLPAVNGIFKKYGLATFYVLGRYIGSISTLEPLQRPEMPSTGRFSRLLDLRYMTIQPYLARNRRPPRLGTPESPGYASPTNSTVWKSLLQHENNKPPLLRGGNPLPFAERVRSPHTGTQFTIRRNAFLRIVNWHICNLHPQPAPHTRTPRTRKSRRRPKRKTDTNSCTWHPYAPARRIHIDNPILLMV